MTIPFLTRSPEPPGDPVDPTFVINAPPYTHRSSGIRALYRLCHHLNAYGYSCAMQVVERVETPPSWNVRYYDGPIRDGIAIYPEIVSGNPLGASKVVRWVLNKPGLLAGDTVYAPDEMVFVYDPQRLEDASRAAGTQLGPARVVWLGLVDPAHIYPDPKVPKTLVVSFSHKGRALS